MNDFDSLLAELQQRECARLSRVPCAANKQGASSACARDREGKNARGNGDAANGKEYEKRDVEGEEASGSSDAGFPLDNPCVLKSAA